MSFEPWVFRGIPYSTVGALRRALPAFWMEPDAASLLEEDIDSQDCMIRWFLKHYPGDPEGFEHPDELILGGVELQRACFPLPPRSEGLFRPRRGAGAPSGQGAREVRATRKPTSL